MGSGTGGDVQYLFATDVLGTNTGHVPRHSKVYGNLHAELERVQKLRVAPSTVVSWTFGTTKGEVKADAQGCATISGLKITAEPTTLSIRTAFPK